MQSKDWAQYWNGCYGENLHLEPDLIDFTFSPDLNQTPVIIKAPSFQLLCKSEKNIFRLHLPIPTTSHPASLLEFGSANMALLKEEAVKHGAEKLIFGGGDRHLFPGIPLTSDLKLWLRLFLPHENEVVDLEGSLKDLVKQNESLSCVGSLRSPQSEQEKQKLLDFVTTEFPGRWAREITHDLKNNFLKHYFAYFIDGQVLGYARLYGWNKEYRGPGTHFLKREEKSGALGPIGVSLKARGKGLGLQILKASWEILLAQGLSRVRVDWVSDVDFYEKRGLKIVQKYQMAQLPI